MALRPGEDEAAKRLLRFGLTVLFSYRIADTVVALGAHEVVRKAEMLASEVMQRNPDIIKDVEVISE